MRTMRSLFGGVGIFLILAMGPGAFAAPAPGSKLVASDYSDRYHKADCKLAAKIPDDERVTFDTPEQAVEAGFMPCKKCHPEATAMSFGKREKIDKK